LSSLIVVSLSLSAVIRSDAILVPKVKTAVLPGKLLYQTSTKINGNLAFTNNVKGLQLSTNLQYTVKLGYIDHGYNEYRVITNKMSWLVWISILYQNNFMVITNKNLRNHGYNEQK